MYLAHGGAVRGYVHRRLPDRLADDVTADVFVVAWRRLSDAPDDSLPWLLGIARGAIANRRRIEARRAALDQRLRATSVPEGSVPFEERAAGSAQFALAFSGLRESDREILRRVAWDGLNRRDAARVLGVSPSVFSVRLHRARRRLQRALAAPADASRAASRSSMEVTK
jgi:RNA polymerase sigma-70 factor (ECF subfamily)